MTIPIKILIVEDSADDAELIIREMKKGGYKPQWHRVDNSEDLESALMRQSWDIILSDYTMPNYNGVSALLRIRRMDIDTPYILVSGTAGEDIYNYALNAGADDFVTKTELGSLVGAVERALTKNNAK